MRGSSRSMPKALPPRIFILLIAFGCSVYETKLGDRPATVWIFWTSSSNMEMARLIISREGRMLTVPNQWLCMTVLASALSG